MIVKQNNTFPRKIPKAYWVIMKPKLLEFLYKLTLLDLTVDDLQDFKLFPKEPNMSRAFKNFMLHVKTGQSSMAREALFKDRFLVYHFDFVDSVYAKMKRTALHYACKNLDRQMVDMLLLVKSDGNQQDIDGLTCLDFAVKNPDCSIEFVRYLMANHCFPTKYSIENAHNDRIKTALLSVHWMKKTHGFRGKFATRKQEWPHLVIRSVLSALK